MLVWNTEENPISSISHRTLHTVDIQEVYVVEDYGTRPGWGVLELSNIVFSVLWLRERKQQDNSCFGSMLSLGLKGLSSVWYLLLRK